LSMIYILYIFGQCSFHMFSILEILSKSKSEKSMKNRHSNYSQLYSGHPRGWGGLARNFPDLK
jgi:IS1 family transposase